LSRKNDPWKFISQNQLLTGAVCFLLAGISCALFEVLETRVAFGIYGLLSVLGGYFIGKFALSNRRHKIAVGFHGFQSLAMTI